MLDRIWYWLWEIRYYVVRMESWDWVWLVAVAVLIAGWSLRSMPPATSQ